jgi:hypothetical protein
MSGVSRLSSAKDSGVQDSSFKITQFDPEAFLNRRYPRGRLIYDEYLNQRDYARFNYQSQMRHTADARYDDESKVKPDTSVQVTHKPTQ